MVAYSFQACFAPPILSGQKRQTIRAVGKRRHAQPGEQLQLYRGMRTKHCVLIARAECVEVCPVTILFDDATCDDPEESLEGVILPGVDFPGGLDGFARADGFESWKELKAFWRKHHRGIDKFNGLLIRWGDLSRRGAT